MQERDQLSKIYTVPPSRDIATTTSHKLTFIKALRVLHGLKVWKK
jgi:hypothetical protein